MFYVWFPGRTTPEQSNAMYLISVVDELFFFFPKPIKTFLKFGYNYKKPEVCMLVRLKSFYPLKYILI
jgi:hypothetical protein